MNNQVKLIEDLEKVIRHELSNFPTNQTVVLGGAFAQLINIAKHKSDTPPAPTIKPGDRVLHGIHGPGTVVSEEITHGNTVFIDYDEHRGGPHITLVRDLEVVE